MAIVQKIQSFPQDLLLLTHGLLHVVSILCHLEYSILQFLGGHHLYIWTSVCPSVCLSLCLFQKIWVAPSHPLTFIRPPLCISPCPKVTRTLGTMKLEHLDTGTPGHWEMGSLRYWDTWTLGQWNTGTMKHQDNGLGLGANLLQLCCHCHTQLHLGF